ncbi:MAG: PDDEXK nuclease domain-containing protein [Gammaproteobacteria bacterium]
MPSPKKSTKLSKADNLSLDKDYIGFLKHVQKRLQNAQLKAARAVSTEQIHFYWELGSDIIKHQANRRWGSHFLDQLSLDMRSARPGMQGFSKRNLEYMRLLATVYPSWDEFTQQPAAQLPWSLIQLLLDKYKADPIKLTWYAEKVIENGWSRSSLSMHIKSDLYERQGIASQKVSNYLERLPSPQSDLAHEMLKNPYNFDFLTVSQEAHEREIENALITHIRDFLLELGTGFSFVGTQVPLDVDGEEFFIDILFYHLKLRSYVVCEIKAKKFKPADLGQLSFYLSAVDSNMKHETDNPTIGILLCESRSKIIAEYALRKIDAPIGVSEYTLSKALPKELKTALPSIETIESELNASIQLDSDHGKK